MPRYRWIMYTSQNSFSDSFDLTRHASLKDARGHYEDYCKAVGANDCHATLYGHDEESWAEALDFKDVGCPFDYPAKVIERGPNGGVRVEDM